MRHADPIAYLELVLVGPTVAYFAFVGGARPRAAARPVSAAAALAMFGAYTLVLAVP